MQHSPPEHLGTPAAGNPDTRAAAVAPGCLHYVLLAAVTLWVIVITYFAQGSGWLLEQILEIEGLSMPFYAWPVVSWIQGLLLAMPVASLALSTRVPSLRTTYQTWLVAIGFLLVLSLSRVFPVTADQPAMLAQLVLAFLCLMALATFAVRRGWRFSRPWRSVVPALALAPIVIAPWLAIGALGSPLDVVLNLLAGLVFGLFAGMLLDLFLLRPLHGDGPGDQGAGRRASAPWPRPVTPERHPGLEGLAASIALIILASGFGVSGAQLLLLIIAPPLGFVTVMVARFALRRDDGTEGPHRSTGQAWLPVGVLLGLVTAGPLVFVDPKEITILLGADDVPGWALRAAALSLLLGGILSLGLWAFWHRIEGPPRLAPAFGGLAVTWLGALLIYFFVGQPGFYGDWLFVILRDQADLTPAHSIADRAERLAYVYSTLTQHATETQADLRATLDFLHVEYRPYYLENGLEVRGGPLLRAYLERRPEVDRVLNSPHLRPLPAPLPVTTGDRSAPAEPPWNITSIGAERVWQELGVTGKGIVVGQSDSGVDGNHLALQSGYRGQNGQNDYNWLDPWNGTRSPTDFGGHGTHTLGSVLGRGGVGVAPDAEWFGCVNLARNMGNPALYLNCMQFMLAPYPENGDPFKDGDPRRAADVLNNSWGCPPLEGCDADALAPAAEALRAAGIFVVASAGNEGPRCASVTDPIAIYGDVFSVGAVDQAGDVALFSSRGPVTVDGSGRVKPDIVAPGVDVLSSLPENTYGLESGTSMAGPHVVGVVALMWSAQPKLIGDIERTEQILIEAARPYTGSQEGCFTGGKPNDAYGYGVVDAYAAVQAALAMK